MISGGGCACCGEPAWPNGRCTKHQGRNPCAVEGCRRTVAAPVNPYGQTIYDDGQAICGTHWRRYVPPGSRARRAYLAFHRQAKRHGWGYKGRQGRSARLDWRFHSFWDRLVRMVRRRSSEGHIDEAEIARLMGWD